MSQQIVNDAGVPPTLISTDMAAELLGVAMRDTERPVMEMAGALARICNTLSRASGGPGAPLACSGNCGEMIRNDIAICIQSLQFHDRLIQQLTAVRKLMGSDPVAGELCSGFMPPEGSIELF
jgi:hypothetical protein